LEVNIMTNNYGETEALERWIRGHHAFIVVDQLQLAVVGAAIDAAIRKDEKALARLLDALCILQKASGTLVTVAANFAAGVYVATVRPHMASYDEQMSGIYMKDHAALQRGITELMTILGDGSNWSNDVGIATSEFRLARTAQLEMHAKACRRNLPPGTPSMIHAARANPDAPAAIDILEHQFNPKRKSQVGCPSAATHVSS
jgi:hypothetical protein